MGVTSSMFGAVPGHDGISAAAHGARCARVPPGARGELLCRHFPQRLPLRIQHW